MGFNTWYPNFYIVLVGPSGKTRKGAAIGPAQTLLRQMDSIHLAADSITRAELIADMERCQDTDADPATQRPILHCSLSAVCTELGVFMADWNEQFIMDLVKWYDCEDEFTYHTKGSGKYKIDGVWFNLLGGTTHKVLRDKLGSVALFGGLASRMVFINEFDRDKNQTQEDLTPEQMDLGLLLLEDMDQMSLMAGRFGQTDVFKVMFDKWYDEQWHRDPFNDPRLAPYVERRQTHLLKLAMVMNVVRGEDMLLDKQDFDSSLELLEATEVKMPYTFSGVGASELVAATDQVMQVLENRHTMTAGELLALFYHDMSKDTLERVVAQMVEMRYVVKKFNPETRVSTLVWIKKGITSSLTEEDKKELL